MSLTRFQLFLFSTDPLLVSAAADAGIDGVIVDWERRGKFERQFGAQTEINADTPEDLRRVRHATVARVICRINAVGETTAEEIETAIGNGADEILVPMIESAGEIGGVLDVVRGRVAVGMLLETASAVARVQTFSSLPLARVYLGLNDLAIERRSPNIFHALTDGTLDAVRADVAVPFGFGGLTLPDCGSPVPCRLLMGEMTRVNCQFSFLRRSFHHDRRGQPLADVVARIRQGLAESCARPASAVARDRRELARAVDGWDMERTVAR